jgi:hypothetical protein
MPALGRDHSPGDLRRSPLRVLVDAAFDVEAERVILFNPSPVTSGLGLEIKPLLHLPQRPADHRGA